ncbi:hypothetical protein PO909_028419, partial [Leuciscus waleckii]
VCVCSPVVFADELKSVKEGDSVTLQINVTEIHGNDPITWTVGTNRSLIAKTIGVNNAILDVSDERFRDRLKLDKKTRSLTIMNIRTEDAGVYEVKISGSSSSSTYRFNVTVYAAPTPDPHSTSRPTSASSSGSSSPPSGSADLPVYLTALIPASAAGFLLLIVAVVIFFIYRKHRKTDQQGKFEAREEEITYADTTFHKRNAPKPVRLCHI